jgi:hypothetical protein
MCKSIQRFKNYVFCGSLPRSNLGLQNELVLFWYRGWEGGVDGAGAIVKRALKVNQLQNPIKDATRCN